MALEHEALTERIIGEGRKGLIRKPGDREKWPWNTKR